MGYSAAMQTVLIYPSCRPGQIISSSYRAKSTTNLRIKVAVGYNGPPPPLPESGHLDVLDHLIWLGEDKFNPPFVEAVNRIMTEAVDKFQLSDADLVGYWSDDFYPHKGWAEALWRSRRDKPSHRFLCPYEPIMRYQVATIPFATWGWWREHMGGLMWPPVLKYVVDVWVTEKAKLTGDFTEVPDCRFEHKHYYAGTRGRDDVDNHNEPLGVGDHAILDRYRREGFPVVW